MSEVVICNDESKCESESEIENSRTGREGGGQHDLPHSVSHLETLTHTVTYNCFAAEDALVHFQKTGRLHANLLELVAGRRCHASVSIFEATARSGGAARLAIHKACVRAGLSATVLHDGWAVYLNESLFE